jgi:hypothetical protein
MRGAFSFVIDDYRITARCNTPEPQKVSVIALFQAWA